MPVGGSAVDRIRDQPADLVRHRSPRVLDLNAQEQLLVPEQKSPQKQNLERNTSAESAMNAGLAQADIKNGFMDMMKLLMHELLQHEQQPEESADDYIHSMQQLASRLKKPMTERQLVKVVKNGLRDGIARYVYA